MLSDAFALGASASRERQSWVARQRHDDVSETLGASLEVLPRRDGGGDGVSLILVSRLHSGQTETHEDLAGPGRTSPLTTCRLPTRPRRSRKALDHRPRTSLQRRVEVEPALDPVVVRAPGRAGL